MSLFLNQTLFLSSSDLQYRIVRYFLTYCDIMCKIIHIYDGLYRGMWEMLFCLLSVLLF